MNENAIDRLSSAIEKYDNICVFTGAGISCPSGIPDFRSADGLYNRESGLNLSPEQIVSHSFFVSHTGDFYRFYRQSMLYPNAKPNKAHLYFAELERKNKNVAVVTQNIDGLHQAAGSSNVIELHGSVHRNYCTNCGKFFGIDYIVNSDGIPLCDKCGAVVKPDVVLYEEMLDEATIKNAVNAISHCDTLIIVGTSLVVYPAAAFINYFGGENIALINKTPTQMDYKADIVIYDDVEKVVQQLSALN